MFTFVRSIPLLLLFLTAGCAMLKPPEVPVESAESRREKVETYERKFSVQVDEAYRMFHQGKDIPASTLVGGDELHLEFALSGKDFWQKLRGNFMEIGRDTRADFTDQFITLSHQGGVRVGFVDLVRAKMIWNALRGDTQTDLVMTLDIPLVPDRVTQENPEQYPKRYQDTEIARYIEKPEGQLPMTVIPKGHIVDVQGAKFADDSLRFAKLDIRFPELKQEGRKNIRTRREGSLKQIKTVTWRESPKLRRDVLSLPQLVLPKGVALVAMVPAECTEMTESSDLVGRNYAPQRNMITTSLIVLMLPKRAADAFAE